VAMHLMERRLDRFREAWPMAHLEGHGKILQTTKKGVN
jgi:hypothetical protein